MMYSPSVAIFRDANGGWLCPYRVDIITSPAVNAGLVRKLRLPDTERRILSVMKERMGRILALFERSGIRNLVLGSFGTGVFQNDIGSLAKIWGELLVTPGSRFADSFDQYSRFRIAILVKILRWALMLELPHLRVKFGFLRCDLQQCSYLPMYLWLLLSDFRSLSKC